MSFTKPGTYLVITADANDGDYVSRENLVSEEALSKFSPLIQAIKQFKPYTTEEDGYVRTHRHNWPEGEYGHRPDLGEKSPGQIYSHIDEEIFEEFSQQFIPYNEYGLHTIVGIKLIKVESVESLI